LLAKYFMHVRFSYDFPPPGEDKPPGATPASVQAERAGRGV
jgi:hypothetical protein